MRKVPTLLIAISSMLLTTALAAAPRLESHEPAPALAASSGMQLAQAKKKGKPKAGAKGVRERHITGEATIKGKDQTNVDFDAADIGGARKAPMGSLINQNKADKNYDFVKIRLRWHPEMIQSASSLDSGSN